MKVKLLWERLFLVNIFALESKKKSKNDKKTHFVYSPRILHLPVNL